ncbi:MAG TPA: choice-of-anchor L domain-containing protein [Flavobacterium sp.]|nr:choice-of-anchor L domain-containing protein [Flavobacterium sp.]
MKKILLSTIFLAVSFSGWSQLVIDNTETPGQLIQNTFMGNNLTISNVKFNGSTASAQAIRDQAARFSNGSAGLGAEQGLILSTGKAIVAIGPNNSASATNTTATPFTGDADLALIAAQAVKNVCIVEFDFIPNNNGVFFEYIFASEEYPEFAGSSFNDTFGLFLSGPGISGTFTDGAINIATIPNTAAPVTINNLNNGTTNSGPCNACAYYVNNGNGSTPTVNTQVQFDGLSTQFTASGAVIPGETYHIKFAIANIGDNAYESAMFLTAGSFRSANLLGTANFTTGKVKMYPNPATDFIRINAADNISEVTVYDLQGRSLMQVPVNGDMEINTQSLSAGTYIVEFVLANKERSTQKLVIK